MKNILIIAGLIFSLSACSSAGTKKVDDKKLNDDAGVSNVNGNIPDTTNAINLNTHIKEFC